MSRPRVPDWPQFDRDEVRALVERVRRVDANLTELLWRRFLLDELAAHVGPVETADDVTRYLALTAAINERLPELVRDVRWNPAWPEAKVRRKCRNLVRRVLEATPSSAEIGAFL
jgi:hypothetical protein